MRKLVKKFFLSNLYSLFCSVLFFFFFFLLLSYQDAFFYPPSISFPRSRTVRCVILFSNFLWWLIFGHLNCIPIYKPSMPTDLSILCQTHPHTYRHFFPQLNLLLTIIPSFFFSLPFLSRLFYSTPNVYTFAVNPTIQQKKSRAKRKRNIRNFKIFFQRSSKAKKRKRSGESIQQT